MTTKTDKDIGSLLFFYAETPLHAGSGVAPSAVDLPVQRERMSGLPMVQGSGIKGALREQVALDENDDLAIFGRKGGDNEGEERAGALALLDARLLLLPVRTVWGGFAWVTSPLILQRLRRDLTAIGDKQAPSWFTLKSPGSDDPVLVGTASTVVKNGSLFVEDLEYAATEEPKVTELGAWLASNALPQTAEYTEFRKRLSTQLAVVPDDEMRYLSEHATEVVARIRIDEKTGTVAKGALWTEESLPSETVLWTTSVMSKERAKGGAAKKDGSNERRVPGVLQAIYAAGVNKAGRIRLGGDRTTGRGVVAIQLREVKS
jgi:CRISPR-associated protein Cmr4